MSAKDLCLDVDLVKKILQQLIYSDGMEVTHQYLIDQHVYYIDNTALVEELETLLVCYYYEFLFSSKGCVGYDELFSFYSPQFINQDKLFIQLEKEHVVCSSSSVDDDVVVPVDNTLNKYF